MNFSVIVPTCHRNDLLARCLDSLAPGVQTKQAWEIIVSDDGSGSTAEALVAAKYPWAKWIPGPGRGPAANRNCGARVAKGAWLAFIDDDCVADPGWLEALAGKALSGALHIVEGRTVIPGEKDSPFVHAVENVAGGCYWTCNLAVEREAFWRIGGFDEDFLAAGGEDMEFAWRFQKQGLEAGFASQAVVQHPPRPYSPAAFGRRIWEGKWILLYRQKVGKALPDSAGAFRIGFAVVWGHFFQHVRNLVYGWRAMKRTNWRRILFGIFWPWVIMPLQLPHMLWWEFQFRRMRAGKR